MKRHSAVSIAILGLFTAMLAISISVWAQKGKPPGPPPPPADPAIAYVAERAWSTTDLMVMNADGSNQRVLLAGGTGPTSIGYHTPSWSPDGNWIAFCLNTQWGAENGIYIIHKDGSGFGKVVAINEACTYGPGNPRWSPDGLKILYSDTMGPGLNEDLYLVDATYNADQTKINLTNSPNETEFYPTWNPNGLQLAATVDGLSETPDIVVFDFVPDPLQGWKAVAVANLTETGPLANISAYGPAWAKSSDRIAVAPGEIWVIDLTNPANPTNLTQTPSYSEMKPSWSALDTQIVYSRDGSIYVMDAGGQNVKRLAAPAQRKTQLITPDWRRNP